MIMTICGEVAVHSAVVWSILDTQQYYSKARIVTIRSVTHLKYKVGSILCRYDDHGYLGNSYSVSRLGGISAYM